MNPVGFFNGSPKSVCCPSWHWSALILPTLSCQSKLVISGSRHDVASLGCSWRKEAPRSICRWYRWQHHVRCTRAFSISAATIRGSRLALFKFWMFEKAVHIGDPIRSCGCSSSSSFSASFRLAGSLKSQGSPLEFVVVRSNASPGMMPSLGFLPAVAVTLGAEYTSETVALSCLVASRLNLRPHCPRDVTRAVMSS